MKIRKNLLQIAIVTIIATSSVAASAYNNSSQTSTANAELAKHLVLMREEEKIARDVYRVLYQSTGIQAFANITQSEQRHMDAMGKQLARFNLADPITDDATGAFNNPEFKKLFKELTEKGQASNLDALMVAAYIEELDIQDLQKAIASTKDENLNKVYGNLLRGSRNHLRAFVKQIDKQGIAYKAQLMPQSEVDMILASAQERGNGGGGKGHDKGHGEGQGHGKRMGNMH